MRASFASRPGGALVLAFVVLGCGAKQLGPGGDAGGDVGFDVTAGDGPSTADAGSAPGGAANEMWGAVNVHFVVTPPGATGTPGFMGLIRDFVTTPNAIDGSWTAAATTTTTAQYDGAFVQTTAGCSTRVEPFEIQVNSCAMEGTSTCLSAVVELSGSVRGALTLADGTAYDIIAASGDVTLLRAHNGGSLDASANDDLAGGTLVLRANPRGSPDGGGGDAIDVIASFVLPVARRVLLC